jgi:hypothetical protein
MGGIFGTYGGGRGGDVPTGLVQVEMPEVKQWHAVAGGHPSTDAAKEKLVAATNRHSINLCYCILHFTCLPTWTHALYHTCFTIF